MTLSGLRSGAPRGAQAVEVRSSSTFLEVDRAELVDCRIPDDELGSLPDDLRRLGFVLGETTVAGPSRKIALSTVGAEDAEVLLMYLDADDVERGVVPVRDAALTFPKGKPVFAVAAGGDRLGPAITSKLRMWEKAGVRAGELLLADLFEVAGAPDAASQIALLLRLPPPGAEARDQVFVSFHPDDVAWYERFNIYLHDITTWSTLDIPTGASISEEIEAAFAATKVAVLLVTQNYVASKELERELTQRFVEASRRNELTLFWVAVQPSTYKRAGFEDLEAFNKDPDVPLAKLDETAQEEEFLRASNEIWELMHPGQPEEEP